MSYSPNYFQFSADNYTVNEGDLYPQIQINRSSGSDAAWLVFSTSDGTAQGGANLGPLDYQNVPGEFVYFEPSQTSAYVYLPNIYDDSHSESNETVNLHLRYVDSSFDLDTAILTIIDNDPAAISPIEFQDVDRDITVSEDVGQATITLTRTYNVGTATVNYATSSLGATATAGSDYTATSGTATFQNGSYTTTFSVSITQDSAPEAQEFFYLVLSNPSANYSIPYSQAKLRIADTNPPNLNIPDQILAPTDVRVRNLVFDASDAGAQSLSFSIVSVGVSTLAQDAYSLDQSLNLTKYPDAQGYRFNIHGLSEKWLYNGSTIWYYILPDGRLFKLLGSSPNPSSDTLQDELSPIIWSRPQLLDSAVSAQSPPSGIVSLSGSFLTIDPPSNYNGEIFAVTVNVSDNGSPAQQRQQTFHVGVVNQPPTLYEVVDRRMVYTTSQTIYPIWADSDPGQTKTWSVSASSYSGAYSLDQSLGLAKYPDSQGYRYNIHSLNEKWLYNGGSDWYYLLPTGHLYKYMGGTVSPANDQLTASLSPIFWQDPALLDSATAPANISLAGVSINSSTGVITIDPPANDYVGIIEVQVSVNDGYDSATETFLVGVYANPISLAAIADQKIGPAGVVSLTAVATDPDSQTITYSISQGVSTLAQQVYNLDQQLGLIKWPDQDGYREDLHVDTAKWMYSTTQSLWYYLLDDGTLHKYNGEDPVSSAPTVATLSPVIWQDPRFLHEATVPVNPNSVSVSTSINSSTGALTVDPPPTYSGIFAVTVTAATSGQSVTRTFHVAVTNEPVTLASVSDLRLAEDPASFNLSANTNDPSSGQVLSWSISHQAYSSAYTIDQTLGLAVHEGGYYQNVHGANEKWLYNSTTGQWFYLLPNGELRRLGSPLNGQLEATLSPIFWEDPRLLHEAPAPQNLDSSAVQVNGSSGQVSVDPPTGYKGIIQATVSVNDGPSSVSQTFLIGGLYAAPTNITLSNSTVVENTPAYQTVGTFSTTDADSVDFHTYSLVAGTGDADNADFVIVGNALRLKHSPDFQFKSSYSIRVRTTDVGGMTFEKSFSISLDRKLPVITSISTDTGASASDHITSDQTLTFNGTAPVNSTVKLFRPGDDAVIGTTTADGNGDWSYVYAITLPEGVHAFYASATVGTVVSDLTSVFLLTVDVTAPQVALVAPATAASLTPMLEVNVFDLVGLADGAVVTIDVDLNNDSDFDDTGESAHTVVSLADFDAAALNKGYAAFFLAELPGLGTYNLRARVTDLAGNEGVTASQSLQVVSSSWSLARVSAYQTAHSEVTARDELGAVTLSHALDLDLSPGSAQAGNPALVYDGRTVVKPIIQAEVQLPNGVTLPSTIGVELIWDGVSQGTNNYSTAGLKPGDLFTTSVQVTGSATTGRHTWEIRLTYSGLSDLVQTGVVYVVNQDDSPFGAGWNLSILNRLIDIPASGSLPAGQLWIYGNGTARFFEGSSGTLTSPAEDNGTLVKNGGGDFTYTSATQAVIQFDSSGYQTSWTSPDGEESIAFSYTSGLLTGLTAIDGSTSTFNYSSGKLTSISAPGSRTFATTITSGDLLSITDPDARVHSFTYASHRVATESFGSLSNQFGYDSAGLLNSRTWGSGGSPSVYAVVSVGSIGLAGLSKGPALASVTDPLDYVTRSRFDAKGRLLEQISAEGGKSVWTLDAAGRVTQFKDPLGRVTSYTRDAKGFVTRETLADSNYREWTYDATWHVVDSFTDERGKTTVYDIDATTGHVLEMTDAELNDTVYVYSSTTGLLESVTDPLGKVTTFSWDSYRRLDFQTTKYGTTVLSEADYEYDSHGHLDTTEDAQGLIVTTTHDAMGRLLSRQVGDLDGAEWDYNSSGLLEEFTDENGNITGYAFDVYQRGLLQSTTDAAENTALVQYDDAGRKIGAQDMRGQWTYAVLDALGRTIAVIDPQNDTVRTVFNLAGEVVAAFDQHGNKSAYTYNSRGWVTATVDPRGMTTASTFDAAGNLLTFTDERGKITQWEYDDLGRVKKAIDAEDKFVTWTYWEDGRIKDTTDARGIVTRYDVDFANRKQTTTEAFGTASARTFEQYFDDVGFVTEVKDALGHSTFYVADAYHRLDQIKDHNNVVKADYAYDDAGNVTQIKDALNKITTLGYDVLNRQTQSTDPNANTTQSILDADGRQIATIDAAGQTTRYGYDPSGRMAYTVDPNGGVTKYTYDAQGNLSSLTDPVGNVTRWFYDANGNVIKEIDPRGEVKIWTYNDANQVATYTDRLGRFREYTYYDDGMLHTEVWKTSSVGSTVNTITWTYNEDNQPLTVTDNAGTITWTYDDLGRLETQEDVHGVLLTWVYDDADRIETLTDEFGGVLTYVWANDNRLSARSFDDGTSELRIEYDYNDRDQVSEIRRYDDAAGTTLIGKTLYGYDDGGRTTSIHHKDDSNGTIDNIQYTYDAANRIATETSTLASSKTYTHDAVGQLLDDGTNDYDYDLNGNRTMAGYDTDPGNVLASDGVWNFVYDDEGNMTEKENISSGEVWLYHFDHNNRLIEAEHKDSSVDPVDLRVELGYDALGNRIAKSVDADGDGGGAATVENFAYDPQGNAWADLTSAGSLTTRRLYHDAVDALFARIAVGGDEAWYLTDYRGTVRDILDDTGAAIYHAEYDSFGQMTAETGTGGDRYHWTGRERDVEIDLQYNRARYYDPTIGRWISQDPIGFHAGDGNLYRYVLNGPINDVDPSGLSIWDWILFPKTIVVDGPVNLFRQVRENSRSDMLDIHRVEMLEKTGQIPLIENRVPKGSSLRNGWQAIDPSFEGRTETSVWTMGVLANAGVQWAATGPVFVSGSRFTFDASVGRFRNSSTGRIATASEASAASNAAVARMLLNRPGALRDLAKITHTLVGGLDDIAFRQCTVAIAEVRLSNGAIELWAARNGRALNESQRQMLGNFGVRTVSGTGHAEINIISRLPAGAKVQRWGISRSTGQTNIVCDACVPHVRRVSAGGLRAVE